jgi:hypothetical protein
MTGEFNVNIVDLSGKTYPLKVNHKMTVTELKKKILDLTPKYDLLLLKHGISNLIDDCKNLESYGIEHNSKIFMLARLRGGI